MTSIEHHNGIPFPPGSLIYSGWPINQPETHDGVNVRSYLFGSLTTQSWSGPGTCPTQLTHRPGVHSRHPGTSRGSFQQDNRYDRVFRVQTPPDSESSTYTGPYGVRPDVKSVRTKSSRQSTCCDNWQPDLSQHCPGPSLNGPAQPIRPFDRYGNPPSCQEYFSEYSNTHGASEPRPLHLQDSRKVQAAEEPPTLLQLEAEWRAWAYGFSAPDATESHLSVLDERLRLAVEANASKITDDDADDDVEVVDFPEISEGERPRSAMSNSTQSHEQKKKPTIGKSLQGRVQKKPPKPHRKRADLPCWLSNNGVDWKFYKNTTYAAIAANMLDTTVRKGLSRADNKNNGHQEFTTYITGQGRRPGQQQQQPKPEDVKVWFTRKWVKKE
ncbi:hypothetical protein QFC24_002262 [Naganishia onofrii]|uniref:Uncharacterized protein n=1 Tax=Naganishia onofrii TaxID=1851511 RepID=A0ACC2XQS0_9TREE|nr:hypothetical protein QFC24_002262 [Naganishia onofrii]